VCSTSRQCQRLSSGELQLLLLRLQLLTAGLPTMSKLQKLEEAHDAREGEMEV
jgi:hypothetical protein